MDDGGRKGQMTLWVDIDDVNDNSPTFDNDVYSVEVSENFRRGDVLLRVHASDADDADNGLVHYRMSESSKLLHGHMFSVDANSGDVVLTDELDRENMDSHQFIVEAFDAGASLQNSAFVRVSIRVVDENDNDPLITVTSFGNEGDENDKNNPINYFEIAENNEAEKFVAFLSVSDRDEGKNAECICALKSVERYFEQNEIEEIKGKKKVSYSSHFKLTSYYEDGYKLETARSLDREKVPYYEIQVHCFDQGRPQRTSTSIIHLKVTDVNDNRPTFLEKQIRIEVEEGNEVGKLLATLTAQDLDTPENANTFYALQPMVNVSHNIKYMLDMKNTHEQNIHENAANTFKEYKEGMNMEDRINYNVMNLVQLDERTAHLFALVSFDYESMPSELNYKAIAYESIENDEEDEALKNWSWVPVIISIIDQNDEKPVFEQPQYTFEIFENSQTPENILGQVKASDADVTPAFKEILFELMPSITSSVFQIDQKSGIVSTNARFDREDNDVFKLVVKAYNPVSLHDTSKSSKAVFSFTLVNVTIKVIDENDNAPIFKFPSQVNNRIAIPTSHAVGEVVCVVEAGDDDETGANSKISYSIIKVEQFGEKNNPNDAYDSSFNNRDLDGKSFKSGNFRKLIFDLNKTTGEIVSLKALSEEKTYKLTLLAEDAGTPSLSTISSLFIDVNNSKAGLAHLQDVAVRVESVEWYGLEQRHLLPLLFTICCVIASILCLVTIIASAVMCKRIRRRKRNKGTVENSIAMSNSCYTDKKMMHSSLLTSSTCGVGSGYGGIKISDNWAETEEENDTWKELSVHSIESKQSCCSTYNCTERNRTNFSPSSNEVAIKSIATTPLTTSSFCQHNSSNKGHYGNINNNNQCNSRYCCYNSCNSIRSCAMADDNKCTKCSTENNAVDNKGKNYESDTHESLVHKKAFSCQKLSKKSLTNRLGNRHLQHHHHHHHNHSHHHGLQRQNPYFSSHHYCHNNSMMKMQRRQAPRFDLKHKATNSSLTISSNSNSNDNNTNNTTIPKNYSNNLTNNNSIKQQQLQQQQQQLQPPRNKLNEDASESEMSGSCCCDSGMDSDQVQAVNKQI